MIFPVKRIFHYLTTVRICNRCCPGSIDDVEASQPIEINYAFRGRLPSSASSVSSLNHIVESSTAKQDHPIGGKQSEKDKRENHPSAQPVHRASKTGRQLIRQSVVEVKPIPFWSSSRESVQPRSPFNSSELSLEHFQVEQYQQSSLESFGDSCSSSVPTENPPPSSVGQLSCKVAYNYQKSSLEISSMSICNLQATTTTRVELRKRSTTEGGLHFSNSYIRIRLLPEKSLVRLTSIQKKTQSPNWTNETWQFDVLQRQCPKMAVEFLVRDFDKYSHHVTLGVAMLLLSDIDLNSGELVTLPIVTAAEDVGEIGEVQLSLGYLPQAGRLFCDIHQLRGLLQPDVAKVPDVVIKIAFMEGQRIIKSKKSAVKRGTANPVFNESFRCDITEEALRHTTVMVSVYEHHTTGKDDLIGRIMVGTMASGVTERNYWRECLTSNSRSPTMANRWLSLRSKSVCNSISSDVSMNDEPSSAS